MIDEVVFTIRFRVPHDTDDTELDALLSYAAVQVEDPDRDVDVTTSAVSSAWQRVALVDPSAAVRVALIEPSSIRDALPPEARCQRSTPHPPHRHEPKFGELIVSYWCDGVTPADRKQSDDDNVVDGHCPECGEAESECVCNESSPAAR